MKNLITSLLLSVFSIATQVSAQPMMSENEFYYTGDIVQMVNCNIAGINAGASGASVTWDFSILTSSGGLSTTSILHDTSALFSTSNLMYVMPGGTIEFVQESSSDSYINGVYDTNSHITTSYNNYDIAKRPFTYNTSYIDTYDVNVPATTAYGKGYLTETGDAYGTLILPTGTYDNVLRIKKVQHEVDTVGVAIYNTVTISYLWFDTSHRPPLLRIDSVLSQSATTQTVMYLSQITAVNKFNSGESIYRGYFDDNGDLLMHGFETGKNYVVVLYNIIGNVVFTEDFWSTDNSHRFDINRQLSPGIYMVRIFFKNEQSSNINVIKVIKNN